MDGEPESAFDRIQFDHERVTRHFGDYRRRRDAQATRIAVDQTVFPRNAATVNRGYRENFLRPDGTLKEFTAACSPWVYRADLFPPEQVTMVNGDGSAFSGLAFDHLVFTGSTLVGRAVMKAARAIGTTMVTMTSRRSAAKSLRSLRMRGRSMVFSRGASGR